MLFEINTTATSLFSLQILKITLKKFNNIKIGLSFLLPLLMLPQYNQKTNKNPQIPPPKKKKTIKTPQKYIKPKPAQN